MPTYLHTCLCIYLCIYISVYTHAHTHTHTHECGCASSRDEGGEQSQPLLTLPLGVASVAAVAVVGPCSSRTTSVMPMAGIVMEIMRKAVKGKYMMAVIVMLISVITTIITIILASIVTTLVSLVLIIISIML